MKHEIRVRGHRIIYMIHEKVGHLGAILVSSSIAKKEHTEVTSTMKTIEALAPGLYEMTIDEQVEKVGWTRISTSVSTIARWTTSGRSTTSATMSAISPRCPACRSWPAKFTT